MALGVRDVPAMERSNDAVAAMLQEYADLLAISGGDPFKGRAYEKAARTVAGYEGDVGSLDERGLDAIPGIGSSLAAKIAEFSRTGSVDELETLRARRNFFQGRPITGDDIKDVYRLGPTGQEMQQRDWATPLSCLGVLLLNATDAPIHFALPDRLARIPMRVVVDTGSSARQDQPAVDPHELSPRSFAVLRAERPGGAGSA
nr:helix-hairpin-helix domain-containing protein [Pseudonocardia acidicola]